MNELLLPLAHAGHWLIYVLYAVPVLIVLTSVVVTILKERRGGRPPASGQPK